MPPISLGLASGGARCELLPEMITRHGIICGATGTGKTVTLRLLAEQLNRAGLPVFVTDFKGDLSGLAAPGGDSPPVRERLASFELDQSYFRASPVEPWGPAALPLRLTPSELGPELLAQMLELNDNQTGLLQLLFKIADESGLLLLDWKDLQALIHLAETERKALSQRYGTLSPASLGAIKRKFLASERDNAADLFGEPALDPGDLLRGDRIHLLDASRMHPRVYGTLLLWLLAELYQQLPESGGSAARIALFFDEAHLLFDHLPQRLVEQVEQIVRLIRSRGVAIFFITQSPLDIPEAVLAQMGNRVQHALRAYTPNEQRNLRAAARSFRANPDFDTETAIGQLAVGEALVSCLDSRGVPQPVARTLIQPPASRLRPLDGEELQQLVQASVLADKYRRPVERESAYEKLQQRQLDAGRSGSGRDKPDRLTCGTPELDRALGRMANSFGRQLGRELVRGLLGALGGRRR
ncbi:helicase HerA-like domain-containing protein [Microbulbifer litoralis]|uniref:helicase HerA-like domain-containing protein n=1 Tax=Microbulbifer litoralis TaxID=2933965 RepID=UPI0020282E9A|nr:helicase HerA-like domain-containing protein [Microbulbifer sp. GX H0434]